MRILAIDSATQACSAALFNDGECIGHFHEIIGRGHAETLVPAIAGLPDKGKADRILVSLGPGSFTGVRIGLAAARGLGLAWDSHVLGYPTLALVAAMAQSGKADGGPVTVCMAAGHGEYFVQDYGPGVTPANAIASLTPEQATTRANFADIAGSMAQDLAQLLPTDDFNAHTILPDARHALLLPENLLTTDLTPAYGRAPDAKLPGVKS